MKIFFIALHCCCKVYNVRIEKEITVYSLFQLFLIRGRWFLLFFYSYATTKINETRIKCVSNLDFDQMPGDGYICVKKRCP